MNIEYIREGDAKMGLYEEIEKCFPNIEKLLSEKDLLNFKNTSISELYMYHFNLGLWIRNDMLRSKKSPLRQLFAENGIKNPDDMSSIIIQLFHYHISRL